MGYDAHSDAKKAKSLNIPPDDLALAASEPLNRVGNWLGSWRGLVIGVGVGAAIALGATHLMPGPAARTPASVAQKPGQPGQSVTVMPVSTSRIAQTIAGTGSVAAVDMLPILPQVTGLQITAVPVEEGQVVPKGAVLAVLDNSVLQAKLNQAKAEANSAQATVRQKQAFLKEQAAKRNQAESDLRRYGELVQQGAIGQRDFETYRTTAITAREQVHSAETDVSSAQATVQSYVAQVQQIETQLTQTLVRAPEGGIIAEKIARVGDVTASSKLFTIIRDGALELQVKLPENQLPHVRVGTLAKISSDADPRINVQGRVREIAPLVDPQTRQALIKIDVPSSPLLRPGMFLRAAVTAQMVEALTIPARAVIPQTDGNSIVYVLDSNNVVHVKPITVGARQDSSNPNAATVEIKTGLQLGDRVVVAGAGYVKDGDRVTVVSN